MGYEHQLQLSIEKTLGEKHSWRKTSINCDAWLLQNRSFFFFFFFVGLEVNCVC